MGSLCTLNWKWIIWWLILRNFLHTKYLAIIRIYFPMTMTILVNSFGSQLVHLKLFLKRVNALLTLSLFSSFVLLHSFVHHSFGSTCKKCFKKKRYRKVDKWSRKIWWNEFNQSGFDYNIWDVSEMEKMTFPLERETTLKIKFRQPFRAPIKSLKLLRVNPGNIFSLRLKETSEEATSLDCALTLNCRNFSLG